MQRTIYLVVKLKQATSMLQHFDVFENFKFVGDVLPVKQAGTHFHLTARELLDKMVLAHDPHEDYELVGVIVPDNDAAFLPNHKVFSTGTGWCTIEEMVGSYNAKLVE